MAKSDGGVWVIDPALANKSISRVGTYKFDSSGKALITSWEDLAQFISQSSTLELLKLEGTEMDGKQIKLIDLRDIVQQNDDQRLTEFLSEYREDYWNIFLSRNCKVLLYK